jgi:putative CocE/NonD family hydrolase
MKPSLRYFLAALAFCAPVLGQAQQIEPIAKRFAKTEAMISMRDGVKLYTTIYGPKTIKGPLPFIFLRTPYGIESRGPQSLESYLKDLADEGYIFVFQDIRGRFKSEGTFVMSRAPRDPQDPKAIDENTDTNDTIDWLLKNVPDNNGRVGMLGISYPGWLTVMGALEPHPALKAVSPQASPADQFLGDDFHHNGAFRLSYGFEYVAMMETNKVSTLFKFDRHDTYEWYLKLGALSNVNPMYFKGKMPTWNDFVKHPNYDEFWQKQAFTPYLNKVTVPTLNVAGWFDQEDFYGALKIYELLEKHDKKNQNFLVVGPWNHGGWAKGPGDKLGRINFEGTTGRYFREKVQAAWFNYHLKDKGKLDLPEALMFQTGANKWVSHDCWPPKDAVTKKLYFWRNGQLKFEPLPPMSEPAETTFDRYISDPAKPVPYRSRPVTPTYPGKEWQIWMVEDQRFAHQRPDVLTYETEPLQEDVTVAGSLTAKLFASTSGTDSDFIVRLIDVYPETYSKDAAMGGYQLLISGEPVRARFRKSFEKPEPIVANEVNEYTIDLHWSHHCFRKGHKIMVQVQSTWFPLIDRNPQKYVENIFEAKDADFQSAEQRIHRSPRFPSHVSLQVLKSDPDKKGAEDERRGRRDAARFLK